MMKKLKEIAQFIFSVKDERDYHKKYCIFGMKLKVKSTKRQINYCIGMIRYLNGNYESLQGQFDNILYEMKDGFNDDIKEIKLPKILSIDETLDKIIRERLSVSRYGDGEFRFMIGEDKDLQKFYFNTQFDSELQNRLIEVIKSNDSRHMVCLWDNFGALNKFTDYGKMVARMYMPRLRDKIYSNLDFDRYYGNLNITRPYMIMRDKSHSPAWFNKWKEVWRDKDVYIIEGLYTKFGVGNDLLSTARSVKRILCPAENAWVRYEDILLAAKNIPNDKLVLIALGMTATVLAYDLAKLGYWAIDIGHLDIEYEWFLKKVTEPKNVKGKYTNDASFGGGINSSSLPANEVPECANQVVTVI